jgi:hypothetical protein
VNWLKALELKRAVRVPVEPTAPEEPTDQ